MNKPATLESILRAGNVAFTPRQLQQLVLYQQLAIEWNRKLNLVADSTLPDFGQRHILDSAQLVRYVPAGAQTLLDIGSGAGLPGLVLAVLCPHLKITLAEKIQKKASFLVTAAHKLGLGNVRVHAGRVETLAPEKFDVITARAVAELADLLEISAPLLAASGCWLLLKGEAVDREINALKISTSLAIAKHPSIVAGTGSVLVVRPDL